MIFGPKQSSQRTRKLTSQRRPCMPRRIDTYQGDACEAFSPLHPYRQKEPTVRTGLKTTATFDSFVSSAGSDFVGSESFASSDTSWVG